MLETPTATDGQVVVRMGGASSRGGRWPLVTPEEAWKVRRLVLVSMLLAALAAAYLTMWPVPIAPVAWDPSPAPSLTGPYALNHDLVASDRLLEGFGTGPEDVAFDSDGNLYTGFHEGTIARLSMADGEATVFANTGGRPLGMAFDDRGRLIVADAFRGLLAVRPDGTGSILATGADGLLFGFADDLDIAPDGTIYMSDASTKFGYGADVLDLMEHGGRGRLVAYDPETGATEVVLDGLQFANGVTVAPDGSFVLVAETGAYRIRRLWLDGPAAGTSDVFIDNLPGFPDNINFTNRNTVWVALPSPRLASVDALAPRPFLRKVVLRLPAALQPAPIRHGLVVELDREGNPVRSLHDPTGEVALVTSVMERDRRLYLGSYKESTLVVVDGAVAAAGTGATPDDPSAR
jgi:sugar lactone lactonase YvrE